MIFVLRKCCILTFQVGYTFFSSVTVALTPFVPMFSSILLFSGRELFHKISP